jgi:hypothetical protein
MIAENETKAELWSAVTGHCFDCLGDWSPKPSRVQQPAEILSACLRSTATSRLRKALTSPRTPYCRSFGASRISE